MLISKAIKTKPATMAVATAIAGLSLPLFELSSEAQRLTNLPESPGDEITKPEEKTAGGQEATLDPLQQPYFYCKAIPDPSNPDETVVATVVWLPERNGNVPLLGWRLSEYFSSLGITPEMRCEAVSQKLQRAYEEGRNQLVTGNVNGSPVVCGVKTHSESCNRDNQLIPLDPNENPTDVLKRLTNIVAGNSSEEMLLQSSGGSVVIDLLDWLRKGPITDRDAPPNTRSAGPQAQPDRDALPPSYGDKGGTQAAPTHPEVDAPKESLGVTTTP